MKKKNDSISIFKKVQEGLVGGGSEKKYFTHRKPSLQNNNNVRNLNIKRISSFEVQDIMKMNQSVSHKMVKKHKTEKDQHSKDRLSHRSSKKSLNSRCRQNELNRIRKQNIRIVQKILLAESNLSREEQNKFYVKQTNIKNLLVKFKNNNSKSKSPQKKQQKILPYLNKTNKRQTKKYFNKKEEIIHKRNQIRRYFLQ